MDIDPGYGYIDHGMNIDYRAYIVDVYPAADTVHVEIDHRM